MVDSSEDEGLIQAAEYTLGLLTLDEKAAFEVRLRDDPSAQRNHSFWAESFAGLTDDIAPVAPPASVFTKVEARLFPAVLRRRPTVRDRLGLGGAIGAGILAAFVILWLIEATGALRGLVAPL